MNRFFLLFFIVILSISAYAQIDNSSGFSTPINAEDINSTLNTPLLTPNKNTGLSNNSSFLNKPDETKPLSENKEKNFDMNTDHGLMTKKFDYKPSWLTKDNEISEEFSKGQLLGTFGTKSKYVEILCRDHQYVDGDKVSILINDHVIVHTVNLRADFQRFVIDLQEGRNVIQFLALNQGTSGPNTAHFKMYDENNNLLTENQWNLNTGVKASMVVFKEN
ncbi:MAG: hypothetical protein COZ75_10390 [Flavobacteriaceae bacterium CG_4_8_14_3_um_filter_34_10]|nr:hypothetical protein [Flavobacteriia bacterium]OIP49137.1 MAG: hypothetical protein AUK33_11330 [Flavobacteriaceae bacterium CG2_30_34_30]PIQ19476.1 MAG: hypothetical protein COW66_00935 [Flavobacteriaceae bacterium CG18_big_fil_WC_8_21_14_2_50_34_36]PIV48869.1 MAG: hypothetical protein COS19_11660 [Flavobacteriaceae bacterium CG02_land_8_20_14_3_00_34_13]PIX08751.1 MAG: hypothetical protein COZ75_10390 [Flavobacteriaceae bacterium CG_4_8_14_3_um_filter_34_10]PIZ08325.1 MAG: hypothetical pr